MLLFCSPTPLLHPPPGMYVKKTAQNLESIAGEKRQKTTWSSLITGKSKALKGNLTHCASRFIQPVGSFLPSEAEANVQAQCLWPLCWGRHNLWEDFKNYSLEYFWSLMGPALRLSASACDQRGYEGMELMLWCRCILLEQFLCALWSLKHIVSAPELKARETGKPCRLINTRRNNLPQLGSKGQPAQSCSTLEWLSIFKYTTLLGFKVGRGWEMNSEISARSGQQLFLLLPTNIQHFIKFSNKKKITCKALIKREEAEV